MNCFGGNNGLWMLIILLILGTYGTNILNSKALTGCGLPLLAALAYCMYKNGTLSRIAESLGGGCGCNN